jgi:hypothetical protein
VAFGFRDICWTIAYGGAIWLIFVGKYAITETRANDALVATLNAVYACGTLFYVPLVAYDILRTQLFDIDLRIRWTIKQSTVAAAVAAMPNTVNTPEYAAFRKMQVYEAAVAEALQGGGISQKERALLDRLRDSLGISSADAAAVERELLATGVTPATA